MRVRKNPQERRAEILAVAQRLFLARGYGTCQMEDIRAAAGLSRGGLYHHFDGKPEILAALVEAEVVALTPTLEHAGEPLAALIRMGSAHLGAEAGIVGALGGADEIGLYLAFQERAFADHLHEPLRAAIVAGTAVGRYAAVDADAAADLFLAINAHISRRVLLGRWSDGHAAVFAATALTAFARLLDAETEFRPLIEDFKVVSS